MNEVKNSTFKLTSALVEKNVSRRMISWAFSRYFVLVDRSVVEVVPTSGGQVPRVGRVVPAADRSEVADAAVQVKNWPRVGLQRTRQEPVKDDYEQFQKCELFNNPLNILN